MEKALIENSILKILKKAQNEIPLKNRPLFFITYEKILPRAPKAVHKCFVKKNEKKAPLKPGEIIP